MHKKSTLHFLTRHLYNETDWIESMEANFAMEDDPSLKAEFKGMKEAKSCLPAIRFSPSEKSVQRILRIASDKSSHCLHLS